MKLAKRVTGREEFVAAQHAYHGSTQGALSLLGVEQQKKDICPYSQKKFITFNALQELEKITDKTAAVVLETIQGGAGFIVPKPNFLKAVKARCEEVGALLILDEIQPGIGRTGTLFAYEQEGIIPDILVIGKGLGGGLPIGAFCSSTEHMEQLTQNPALGHITTFGGNPVFAAAAHATLSTILTKKNNGADQRKRTIVRSLLKHPKSRKSEVVDSC